MRKTSKKTERDRKKPIEVDSEASKGDCWQRQRSRRSGTVSVRRSVARSLSRTFGGEPSLLDNAVRVRVPCRLQSRRVVANPDSLWMGGSDSPSKGIASDMLPLAAQKRAVDVGSNPAGTIRGICPRNCGRLRNQSYDEFDAARSFRAPARSIVDKRDALKRGMVAGYDATANIASYRRRGGGNTNDQARPGCSREGEWTLLRASGSPSIGSGVESASFRGGCKARSGC